MKATLVLVAVLFTMAAVAGYVGVGLWRNYRCCARVEQALAMCFSSPEWRGRIAFSVRPRLFGRGPGVWLGVMASTEREVVEALLTVMQELPRSVRVTLDGTVGYKFSRPVHLIAEGTAMDDGWTGDRR